MKFYIPTSSRNFNCLFSEESISPKSFYRERGFGYSKWHSIHENPYENLIVLYDEIKYFERPNEGYDDYPLVIEVNLDNKEIENLFKKDKNSGAYLYDGTLYFNPITTSFIFFDEQHKNIVLSKAEGSLETKLVRIYRKRIQVETRVGGNYDVPKVEDAELNRKELEKSIRVNKVKGFIYGYHIGNLLSVSKEKSFRIKTTQTLLNLASAIYGSIDKRPTPQQERQLQRAINLRTSLAQKLLTNTNFNFNEVTVVSIIEDIQQCGWKPETNSPDGDVLSLYSMIIDSKTQEQAISDLTFRVQRDLDLTKSHIIPERVYDISINSENCIELPVLASEPEDKAIAELWVNGELANHKYKGSLASYRLELATELTKAVRDNVYKDDWENSPARTFLNALRNNLNGKEFSERWSENVFSAIAAVLMKGDTWEGLRLFLISKGIQSQAMSFAFYGIINGFANLPKDFSNILLNNPESDNLRSLLLPAIYEGVNGFGMKAIEDTPLQTTQKNDVRLIPEDSFTTSRDEMDDLPSDDCHFAADSTQDLSTNLDSKGLINQSIQKEINASTPHKYSALWKFCINALQKTTSEKKEDFVTLFSDAINKIFETSNSLEAIKNELKKISLSNKDLKRIWTIILNNTIMPRIEEEETRERMGMNIKQDSLFKSIIDDSDAVELVKNFLEDSSIKAGTFDKKKVLNNFVYVQKNYKPNGRYFFNKSKKNLDVIEHFLNVCFFPKNLDRIDSSEKNKDMVNKVVNFLKDKYPD